MDSATMSAHIAQTQKEVGKLLNDLERRIGRQIRSAALQDFESTTINDKHPTYQRVFVIEVMPRLGQINEDL
jgi:DNA replication initiation complex subunit (GINS family)